MVAACRDLSLRVYTWKDDNREDGRIDLKSRYHLLGGSRTMSRYEFAPCLWACHHRRNLSKHFETFKNSENRSTCNFRANGQRITVQGLLVDIKP